MAVLVGILLGLSRLAADSEIIAMRASGLGIGYFVRVASIVAIGGTLLGLVNSLYLAPRANQAILDMQQALETRRPRMRFSRASFTRTSAMLCSTCRTCAAGTGASNWRSGLHGRRHRSGESDDHHRCIGHRGQRQLPRNC